MLVPEIGEFCRRGKGDFFVQVVDISGQFVIIERSGRREQTADIHIDIWDALHFLPVAHPEKLHEIGT